MKKIIILCILSSYLKSQDTIFSEAYPKGIIVPELSSKDLQDKKILIKKSDFVTWIPKSEIIKIVGTNGVKFENPNLEKTDKFVLNTDPQTGRIFQSQVIECKGATKKQLFDALAGLPNTDVYYGVLSKDDKEYNSLNYRAYTYTKYAGDLYTLYCNLVIRIKDDKIKIEMSDYRMFFSEKKDVNVMGNANYNTGSTHVVNFPLERFYDPKRIPNHNAWESYFKLYNSTITLIKDKVSVKKLSDW